MPWYKYVRNQDPSDSTRVLPTPSMNSRFSFVTMGQKVELNKYQAELIIKRGKYIIETTDAPAVTIPSVTSSDYRVVDITTGAVIPSSGLEFIVVDGFVQSISYRP